MPRACVLLAPGFEEIEAVTIIDVLRRAEIEVVTLRVEAKSPDDLAVRGSHDIVVEADRPLDSGADDEWDIVILPGGLPGSTNLRDSDAVQSLIARQNTAGRRIGAICAAPIALARAGVLKGKRATSYPGFEGDLPGAVYVTGNVVRDRNVITSRGPGTAFEFALEIAGLLQGKQAAGALRSALLVAP